MHYDWQHAYNNDVISKCTRAAYNSSNKLPLYNFFIPKKEKSLSE